METVIKAVRTISAIPVLGNLILIVISFIPLLLAFMLKIEPFGLTYVIGGLGISALFYFLKAKNVINVLAPGGIPMWIVGLVGTLFGVYLLVSGWLA